MSEVALAGGGVNVGEHAVFRVGDTVRRPVGPHTRAVHALLRHFESVGFAGVPRVLGLEPSGREILSYVEGDAALAPVPSSDEVVAGVGIFLRAMHDAQADFLHAQQAPWQRMVGAPVSGEVVCHNDFFWPNLVFHGDRLVGLIDWDLAAPGPRLDDLASAANFWVALRPDSQCEAWGIPIDGRASRLRSLCDGYGLERARRRALLDAIERTTGAELATYRAWGRDERRRGWAELWDRDQDRYLVARSDWFDTHRREVGRWLS